MSTSLVSALVAEAWEILDKEHPARCAIAAVTDPDVRAVVAAQSLRPKEFTAFAETNLTASELAKLLDQPPIVDVPDDVRTLAAASRIDRHVRRSVFDHASVFDDTSEEEQYQLALSLEQGPGRDDFVHAALPRWVALDYAFNAQELAPTLGASAGAHLLAATGPVNLTDDQVWELIINPPRSWLFEDEPDRKWFHRSGVRDALHMVFTHRPELTHVASADPDLAQYAARSPHWEADFAHSIRGFDLESQTVTDEATVHTPMLLLSLVWNPKTPAEHATAIAKVAEHGLSHTPHTKEWEMVKSAAERRVELQPWHVVDYNDVSESEHLDRLLSRIRRGFGGASEAGSQRYVWPKRFEEALALLTNPSLTPEQVLSIRPRPRMTATSPLNLVGPYTTPVGTWSRSQLAAAGCSQPTKSEMSPRAASQSMHPVPYQSWLGEQSGVRDAVLRLGVVPECDLAEAWNLFLTLAKDTPSDLDALDELADTTLAILA